jgi:hypothetical protein
LKGITSFFLRAKHWQVFVLMWGTYFVGTMALVGSVPEGPVENPLKVGLLSEAVMLPFILCSMGWLWSMGLFLFSIAEPSLKLNIHYFRFAIIFPTLYLLTGLPFFLSRNPIVENIIVPLHLLALFCFLYALYFVSNENTNGLLRQYFPKRTDLSGYTQSDLDKVALRLNQRPRKTLGFQTPASKLRASVASTH